MRAPAREALPGWIALLVVAALAPMPMTATSDVPMRARRLRRFIAVIAAS